MGDDLKPSPGMKLTFLQLLGRKKGETVWFSYVEYKSRKHRDMVNKKVMAEFAKKYPNMEMPAFFKQIRMAMGGFTVEASS